MYNQTMAETYLVQFFRFRYTSRDTASPVMGSTSRDVDGRHAYFCDFLTLVLDLVNSLLVIF